MGSVALGAYVTSTRAARLALPGLVLATTGQILFTVPAALSTFATPAIGAAYLDGHPDVLTLQFPAALGPVTALALLLTVVGTLLLATAVWRSHTLPKWTAATLGAGTITFYLLGAALGMSTTGATAHPTDRRRTHGHQHGRHRLDRHPTPPQPQGPHPTPPPHPFNTGLNVESRLTHSQPVTHQLRRHHLDQGPPADPNRTV